MTSPRETFDRSLKELLDEILVLGSMVEQAIVESVEALLHNDMATAKRIYHGDEKINEKRYTIENQVLTLIATQQPMARDLRLLAAILEINTELERMGDYAKGIAKINLLFDEAVVDMPSAQLHEMAERGLDMLHRALSSFISKDVEAARKIPAEDDLVDQLYVQIFHDLMNKMIAEPTRIDQLNYLIWAAHNLERMADRVTNICELIVFVITGEMKELDVTDDEFRFMRD